MLSSDRPGAGEGPVAIVGMLAEDTPAYHAVCGPINRQVSCDSGGLRVKTVDGMQRV